MKPPRLDSSVRGWFIAGFLAVYGLFAHLPGPTATVFFLVGAVVQLGVILIRRFVPAESQPGVMYVFEYLADGISVLMFALGVFGGIAALATDI